MVIAHIFDRKTKESVRILEPMPDYEKMKAICAEIEQKNGIKCGFSISLEEK